MEKIQNFLDFLLRKQNKSKFRYTKSKDAETQQFRSSKSVEKKNKEEAYNFSKNFTESSIPNSLVDSETFWKKIIFSQSLDSKFSTPKKKPNHILHHPIKKEKPVLIKEIPEKRNISSNSEKVELLREELILEQEEQEFCDFNQWLEKEFNSPFSNHELQVNRPLPSISTKRPRQLEISQDPPSKKTKLENNKEILKSTVPILNLMELDEELFSFSSEKVKEKFYKVAIDEDKSIDNDCETTYEQQEIALDLIEEKMYELVAQFERVPEKNLSKETRMLQASLWFLYKGK